MSEHTAMYDLFKDFAGPFAVVAAAIVAAWVTITFSSKQTKIAQTQADIASGEAENRPLRQAHEYLRCD